MSGCFWLTCRQAYIFLLAHSSASFLWNVGLVKQSFFDNYEEFSNMQFCRLALPYLADNATFLNLEGLILHLILRDVVFSSKVCFCKMCRRFFQITDLQRRKRCSATILSICFLYFFPQKSKKKKNNHLRHHFVPPQKNQTLKAYKFVVCSKHIVIIPYMGKFRINGLFHSCYQLLKKLPYYLRAIVDNTPRSFLKTQNFEIGLSDYHKLIVSVLKASFKNLP